SPRRPDRCGAGRAPPGTDPAGAGPRPAPHSAGPGSATPAPEPSRGHRLPEDGATPCGGVSCPPGARRSAQRSTCADPSPRSRGPGTPGPAQAGPRRRRGGGARSVDEADSGQRPVNEDRLPDDIPSRHVAKEPAVLAVVPVVAEHEILARRHGDRTVVAEIGFDRVPLLVQHRTLQVLDPVLELHTVSGEPDDPLDE